MIGYETVGAGLPLLLVHGRTGARWWSVTPALRQRYTAHAVDPRGRGLSTVEVELCRSGREAKDVGAVAEAVGGDVCVMGHSYRALAVLEAALSHQFSAGSCATRVPYFGRASMPARARYSVTPASRGRRPGEANLAVTARRAR
jgi:pimeloyl-ACP methyl ester carboxylesterase